MKTKVVLHGALATAVGRAEWLFKLSTPSEAFQAIEANTGKLLTHLYDNLYTEYQILVDGKGVESLDEFGSLQRSMQEIHILPVLKGASKDSGSVFLIIGLAIIAIVLTIVSMGTATGPGVSGLMSAVSASKTASFFIMAGITLTLSGISAMMAPDPAEQKEKPENEPSYIFSGAVNTYRSGNPVPIGFGELRVGSQVIAASMKAVDILQ